MNSDEIIRMAREAVFNIEHGFLMRVTGIDEDLERFANLIAAAEREACAKLCDEIAIDMWKLYKGRPPYKGNEEGRASDFIQGRSAGADDCADAIRRRTDAA